MRAKFRWGLVWGAVLMTFLTMPSRRAAAGNCALYARAQTGVNLFGAAGGWWDEAAGLYQRGKALNLATHFAVDDVIDPADSRRWIIGGLRAAPPMLPRVGKKRPCIDTW